MRAKIHAWVLGLECALLGACEVFAQNQTQPAAGLPPVVNDPQPTLELQWLGLPLWWNSADPWSAAQVFPTAMRSPTPRSEGRTGLTAGELPQETRQFGEDGIFWQYWSGRKQEIAWSGLGGVWDGPAAPGWVKTPFPDGGWHGFTSQPTAIMDRMPWIDASVVMLPAPGPVSEATSVWRLQTGEAVTQTTTSGWWTQAMSGLAGAVSVNREPVGGDSAIPLPAVVPATTFKDHGPEVRLAQAADTWPLSWAIDTSIYTLEEIGPLTCTSGNTYLPGKGFGDVASFHQGGLNLTGAGTYLLMPNYDVFFIISNPDNGTVLSTGSTFNPTNYFAISGGATGSFSGQGDYTGWLQFTPPLEWLNNVAPLPPSNYVLHIDGAGSSLNFSNFFQIDMWYYGWLVTNGGALTITGVPAANRGTLPSINGVQGGNTILGGTVAAPEYNNAGIVATGANSRITLTETGPLVLGTPVFVGGGATILFDGTSGQGGNYTADLVTALTLSGTAPSLTFQHYTVVNVGAPALPALTVATGTLTFTGTGDGSYFNAAGPANYAATASGAALTIANFQGFVAAGESQLTATGGGKVTISGSNTGNSQLALLGPTVTVNGTGAAAISTLLLSNFGVENIQTNLTAGPYGQIYLPGGFVGLTIGTADAPRNLLSTGPSADLRINNYAYTIGPLGSLTFFGNATAALGGQLYLDGSPDGTTPVSFSGNLTATGTGSAIVYRYFGNQVFLPSQSLMATGGGEVDLSGAATNPATGNLSFDGVLSIGTGSHIYLGDYTHVTVGALAGAGLKISAGTLEFLGLGAGSTFTAAGASPIGATGKGAAVIIGGSWLWLYSYTGGGYEQFTATGTNPLVATGGGHVMIYGAKTAASRLVIASGSTLTVGGDSSATQSQMSMEGFLTVDIQSNLLAGHQGDLAIGTGSKIMTIGTPAAPVDLMADGAKGAVYNSWLHLNNTGAGTGNALTFYGNIYARNAGWVFVTGNGLGSVNFPDSADGSIGNLSAIGSDSRVAFGGFMVENFTPRQTLTLSGGAEMYLEGCNTSKPTTQSLTFNPTLNFSGSGNILWLDDYHTVVAGSDPAAQLEIATGAIFNFADAEAGSSFTVAGVSPLGAIGPGAMIVIGDYQGMEHVGITGTRPLEATGGGSVSVRGSATAASNLVLDRGAVIKVGGTGATAYSHFNIANFQSLILQESLLAGSYSYFFVTNSVTGNTVIGTAGAPANLTADGQQANLYMSLPHFTLYGDIVARHGGYLTIQSSVAGNPPALIDRTANFTGSILSDGTDPLGNPSIVIFEYYNSPTFTSAQSIRANNGGYVEVTGLAGYDNANASLTLGPSTTAIASASGRGSAGGSWIDFNGFNQITVSSVVNADTGGTVSFDAIKNTTLSLTTSGDATGNVSVSGMLGQYIPVGYGGYSYAGPAPLWLSDTHATGSALNFSSFDAYTVGANVEADGGGINFFGSTDPNTGALVSTLTTAPGQTLVSRNAGWGMAQDLSINAFHLAVDATSSFSLKNVTVTGSTLTYGVSGASVSPAGTSLFSDVTLRGAGTVLAVLGGQRITLDNASLNAHALIITNGAQLQLTGDGAHQVLSSGGAGTPARMLVSQGGSLGGAGNTGAHQFALDLGAGGSVVVGNAGNGTSTTANQTLTILGDIQMAANTSLAVSIWGSGSNASGRLAVGSAGTPASLLNGTLLLTVAAGVTPDSSNTYVIFEENNNLVGNRFAGQFGNAGPGGTVTSADGAWLFGVTYTNSQVILGNATAVPEPATVALALGLAALALAAGCRRGRGLRPAAGRTWRRVASITHCLLG